MEPHPAKSGVVPGLPRLVRYGKILSDFLYGENPDNFAILVGVIRQHACGAESDRATTAFIRIHPCLPTGRHGLKAVVFCEADKTLRAVLGFIY